MGGWDAAYETLRLEEAVPGRPEVAVLTLDRPERYNAMTTTMFDELAEAAHVLDKDERVRAVVLTGAGRGFCSGYDLADAEELPHLGAMGMLRQQERAARALLAVRSMRPPVIAAVNGPAAGGGFSLALAADIRLASTAAAFNAAFVRIGLSAGDLGVSWLLTRLVGPAHASEICFTGRIVEAAEAERLGLVNRLYDPDTLMSAAIALAQLITTNSPGGVKVSKTALLANMEVSSYAAAMELENRGQALLSRGSDMPEALAAFKEKRPAVWTGN